jgi:predicted RNA-binding Zn-ribbon protein involved in translation (DUF1610 family)
MIQCQNCGQVNAATSNFCRFCGTKFLPAQFSGGSSSYEFEPPRPYVWKTDEFQVSESRARKSKQINQVQPLNNTFINNQTERPQPLASRQQYTAYAYRCPRCSNGQVPRYEKKVSTAGWIVFAALMVVFFPLFWIGLLIKEDVPFCSVCNLKLN